MTLAIYNGLEFSTKSINQNFKMWVYGSINGQKVNTLVGVAGLIRMVDDIELTNKLIRKAFNCTQDKLVCKLRRGIKITFYVY